MDVELGGVKSGTPRHPKVARLMRALGIPRAHAVGLLEMLWQYTAERAPRGDVGRWTDQEIADALEWGGDASALVRGLVDAGWLDGNPIHRLLVHDWKQHAEDRVHMALARRIEAFADGTVPTLRRLSQKEREEIQRKFRAHKKRTACALPAVAVALPSPPLPKPSPAKPNPPAMRPESLPPTATATASAPIGAAAAADAVDGKPGSAIATASPPGWSREACDDWINRFGGTAPGGRIGSALKPLVQRLGWDSVRTAWQNYLAQAEARFANAQSFANTFGEWSVAPATGTGQALARVVPPGQSKARFAADRIDEKVAEDIARARASRVLGGDGGSD